uniref:Ubiquinol-cytochrome-c reductase complex assembly factor 3 n=1 Tax=Ornithorhynchus anatinus TaxID=9258 RepID=A0A6I8NSH5_ORNAN
SDRIRSLGRVAMPGSGVRSSGSRARVSSPGPRGELPEGNPQRRSEATETKKLLLATLQEAAATQENVAYRKNWNRGSVGGEGPGRA